MCGLATQSVCMPSHQLGGPTCYRRNSIGANRAEWKQQEIPREAGEPPTFVSRRPGRQRRRTGPSPTAVPITGCRRRKICPHPSLCGDRGTCGWDSRCGRFVGRVRENVCGRPISGGASVALGPSRPLVPVVVAVVVRAACPVGLGTQGFALIPSTTYDWAPTARDPREFEGPPWHDPGPVEGVESNMAFVTSQA